MNGKRHVPPEKKQKKIDRMKCHFKQEWKRKNLVTHIIGHSAQRATDRRRLPSALAN